MPELAIRKREVQRLTEPVLLQVPEGAAAALSEIAGHPTSMMAHGFIAIATRCLWPERLWAGSRPRRACRER